MGNLVCLERWSKETGTCDISLVDFDIFTIPAGCLMFSGLSIWMEILTLWTSAGKHGQPCMSEKVVEGNWNLRYLTGGLWYIHYFKDYSYVFRPSLLNGDTDAKHFYWQTWATLLRSNFLRRHSRYRSFPCLPMEDHTASVSTQFNCHENI